MENNDRDRIIEKIKKVLELSKNNPSQAEAAAAAAKAQKLMVEYHVTISEVESENYLDEISSSMSISNRNAGRWKYILASVIARNFRCKYYIEGTVNEVVFYGYKTDCEIAGMTFENLCERGRKSANNAYQKARNEAIKKYGYLEYRYYFTGKRLKDTFIHGYIEGIKEVLEAQSTALMVIVPQEVEKSYTAFI